MVFIFGSFGKFSGVERGGLWILSIYPTYGFGRFWAGIRSKKRQKFAFIRVFARFLVTFSRLCTFLTGEKMWKLNS